MGKRFLGSYTYPRCWLAFQPSEDFVILLKGKGRVLF